VTGTGTEPASGLEAGLAALRARPASGCDKGFGAVAPVTPAELARQRPDLFGGGFSTPVLVLADSALRHNVEAMAAYASAAGVDLAPHGKTTMAPQLFARQLAAGAWAMTAATATHMRAYRAFGVPRILLANELTDPAGIAWLAGELAADPGFECFVYADSLAGVRLLDEVLTAAWPAQPGRPGRALPVLVELGFDGGRTGCRTLEEALSVAAAVRATSTLRLAGAAGYEGGIGHECTPDTLEKVAAFCRRLREFGGALEGMAGRPDELILTAGGSAYFDIVAAELPAGGWTARGHRVVLRSGAYIAHDHGLYDGLTPGRRASFRPIEHNTASPLAGRPPRTGPVLRPALEVWTHVLSRPEPRLVVLSAGRRDVSFDAGLPVPLRVRKRGGARASTAGMRVTKLDDQHAYLSVPAGSGLAPGDLVGLGISHPCTTFDKWRVIPVVDDAYRVIDAVHTLF
jgi:D-serine deaminase-like pyridoxal phosphate-dependent protein